MAAGMLAGAGDLAWSTALIGCYTGIVVGDGLLWLLGHTLGRRALELPVVRTVANPARLARAERWFDENGLRVVLISRFLPGSRFPTYLAAGILGARARNFLLISLTAALLWTPALVWASARFSNVIGSLFKSMEAHPIWAILASILILLGSIQLLGLLSSRRERALWRAKWARRLRWEFLPLWVLEGPVLLYSMWLALRFRGLRNPLVVNPCMPLSGFVGESKAAILEDLDDGSGTIARTLLLEAESTPEDRWERAEQWRRANGLGYPLIVKPDVGQRGRGLKKVGDGEALREVLAGTGYSMVVQEYLDLPFEAGVGYRREAFEERGHVDSITLKEFPTVTGDGVSSLEGLVVRHPRQRLWAKIFLERLGERVVDIPAAGEVVSLGVAGNHAQGTTFHDGSSLVTPELEARIDELAHGVSGGFHLGRFDVRAPSREDFLAGRGLRIMELNGVTGEPTHVYSPGRSIFAAWRDLGRHWHAAFRIGRALRKAGSKPPALRTLVRAAWMSWLQGHHHPKAD